MAIPPINLAMGKKRFLAQDLDLRVSFGGAAWLIH